jgi:hypothetical protein
MGHKLLVLLLTVAALLSGCAHQYQWTSSHYAYKAAPRDEIAVAGVDKAFVLIRSAWFAKKLGISPDSIQTKVTAECSRLLNEELKKRYPRLKSIPSEDMDKLPEESLKLDQRIFIKGKFPEQGVAMKDSSGNVPKYILIVHEVLLGTDLSRENYFDYALIHNESSEIKTHKNLTAIVSYTLWDNEKQRSLFSAVDQVEKPIVKVSMGDVQELVSQIATQIQRDLDEGVVP